MMMTEDKTKGSVEGSVTLSKGSSCRSRTEVGEEQLIKKNVVVKIAHGHHFKTVQVYEMRSIERIINTFNLYSLLVLFLPGIPPCTTKSWNVPKSK